MDECEDTIVRLSNRITMKNFEVMVNSITLDHIQLHLPVTASGQKNQLLAFFVFKWFCAVSR